MAGGDRIPSRQKWPEAPAHSEEGRLLTDLVVTTFRLNGLLLEVAQRLASEGGITAAWWQVLGGVLDEPRTVAAIGRRMGMTRQAVQRIADILVDRGLAEYRPNPAHRRAKLLSCTETGYYAIRQISVAQHPWSDDLGRRIGVDRLASAVGTMQQLIGLLESD